MLKKGYQYEDGIYIYTFADKTVKKIKDFYQDDPFPNYEINDDKAILQKRGDSNTYTRELKNYIGYGKKIIEIGAGTCQLSNYLAIGTNNSIVALDANFNSLKLGKDFAVNNDIKNVSFVCADILMIGVSKIVLILLFAMEYYIILKILIKLLNTQENY